MRLQVRGLCVPRRDFLFAILCLVRQNMSSFIIALVVEHKEGRSNVHREHYNLSRSPYSTV